jgi:hypothetical protein
VKVLLRRAVGYDFITVNVDLIMKMHAVLCRISGGRVEYNIYTFKSCLAEDQLLRWVTISHN